MEKSYVKMTRAELQVKVKSLSGQNVIYEKRFFALAGKIDNLNETLAGKDTTISHNSFTLKIRNEKVKELQSDLECEKIAREELEAKHEKTQKTISGYVIALNEQKTTITQLNNTITSLSGAVDKLAK